MKIEDFLQLKSFDDFKLIGKKLIEINDLPQWFWDYSDIPFNYNMLPDYCKLVNEYRMRFITIEFDNDIVGFCFKVVQIIKTKQIKLFEVPFSLNHNNNNVKTILQHLNNVLNKQFILLSNIYIGEIDKENCNYYYTYNYYQNRVTPKYRRQHRFKRYENNFELKIINSLDNNSIKDFIEIQTIWHKLKKNPSSPQSFLKAIKTKGNNYIYYLGYLNNIPCICGIGIKTKFGIYIVFEYSLDRTNILYDSIVIYTSKILTEKLYLQYGNINFYKLGARKTEKGLLEFKERTSESKVISYKINIQQLLNIL